VSVFPALPRDQSLAVRSISYWIRVQLERFRAGMTHWAVTLGADQKARFQAACVIPVGCSTVQTGSAPTSIYPFLCAEIDADCDAP
jgi:hypothetical protein